MKQTLLYLFVILTGSLSMAQAQKTITGTVSSEGEPLIGANILISNTGEGTITDFDGSFTITTNQEYPISLSVSFIGYETQSLEVTDATPLNIQLVGARVLTEEVVISASRRAEKLQEAPAAVSVISTKQVSASGGSISPIRALINTPGVELQQQTGQRINLALRGSSGIFSTDVFPMLDYRSLISPGLEIFDSQNSPINGIDVERIEVVLGPGSALYGPDVTSGVVHFISKDPFRHPGTTVEAIYGERNTKKIAIRHAGHNESAKFGYKVNARYGNGDDFHLDPEDPIDQRTLNNFIPDIRRGNVIGNPGYVDPSGDGPILLSPGKLQDPKFWAAALNGQLHFRPSDQTQIVASGGWNGGGSIFYNDLGEGYNESQELWSQLRVNHKGLFAQVYYITNDGGNDDNPVFLNRTGLIVPLERTHLEGQVQYNFELPFLKSQWTTGFDYRHATANTENHVYGRNEADDDYTIYGTYLQGKFALGDKVDFFLAGRVDKYNFTDETTFAPRAALVYKPNQYHSLRLSYNRAPNPIPASDIYFDLPIQVVPPLFNVWNMGGIRPQTFGATPMVEWTIPGLPIPNTPFDVGFPLDAAYAAVNADVIAGIQALGSQDPTLAPLIPALVQLLQSQGPGGFSGGLASTDLNGEEFLPVDGETVLIRKLSAFEFGYKGLFWDKFAAGFDVYYFRNTAAGGFGQVSPVVTLTSLPGDLGAGVQATFQPQIAQLLQAQLGLDAATAGAIAGQVGSLLNGAYTQGGQAFIDALSSAGLPFHGIIPTEQLPDTELPNLAYGYITRDPDAVSDDWGFEVHTRYYFSDVLSSFANYTWFNRPTGEAGDLNFPQNKIRTGIAYSPDSGIQGSLSYQWDQAYTSNNSTFPGKINARSLVDASVGYQFDNGLTLEASATNMLNNEFRALPNFPKIGRTITGRVLYNF